MGAEQDLLPTCHTMNLDNLKLVTADTETGGLDPFGNALLQIGAFDASTGSRFNLRCRPEGDLSVDEGARKVNGWPESHSGHEVVSEKELVQRYQAWITAVKPDFVIFHNAPFDVAFIKGAYHRQTQAPHPRAICTMSYALALYEAGGLPISGSLSLNNIAKELAPNFSRNQEHCALEDAMLTWECFVEMKNRLGNLRNLANNNAHEYISKPQPTGTAHASNHYKRRIAGGR